MKYGVRSAADCPDPAVQLQQFWDKNSQLLSQNIWRIGLSNKPWAHPRFRPTRLQLPRPTVPEFRKRHVGLNFPLSALYYGPLGW